MYRFKLKLLYLCCCLLVAAGVHAQDNTSYFVYIQHEKQQPFYVKLDGKLLSSSVKGYVILPRLQAGKVPITVGFPKGEAPEQEYVIRLTGKRDYGYLLKNTAEKQYTLYDLQTYASLKSGGQAPAEPEVAAPAEAVTVARISDSQASPETKEMMDNVQADVETALNKPQADTAPKKKGSFAEALDRVVTDDRPDDMPLEAAKPKPKPPVVTEPVAPVVADAPPAKKSKKNRRAKEREPLTDEEQALLSSVLEDEKKAAADEALKEAPPAETVKADAAPAEPVMELPKEEAPKKERKPKKKKDNEPDFIDFDAAPAGAAAAEGAVAETVEKAAEGPSAKELREAKRQQRKAEREAADREALVKDSIANAEFYGTPVVKTEEKKASSMKMVNSDCEKLLEVDAFRKLLRTMNSKKTDDDMIDAFRKGTRGVCVSTEQIRALAQLIAAEDSRYQLLDAAYPRTYDTDNFGGLSDLLKEDYYKGRFKAMIKR
ncbi:DUF4476 domain-containing protein [Chitinophaga lutea]